jgi:hypothetical protein
MEVARDLRIAFAPQQVVIEDLEIHVGSLNLWAGFPDSYCRGGGLAIDGPSGFLSGCNGYRDPYGGAIFAVDRADLDADLNGRLRLVVDGDFRPALLAVDARELVFSTEDGRVMAADKEAGPLLPRYSPTLDSH